MWGSFPTRINSMRLTQLAKSAFPVRCCSHGGTIPESGADRQVRAVPSGNKIPSYPSGKNCSRYDPCGVPCGNWIEETQEILESVYHISQDLSRFCRVILLQGYYTGMISGETNFLLIVAVIPTTIRPSHSIRIIYYRYQG
jgi:hypothetical protein